MSYRVGLRHFTRIGKPIKPGVLVIYADHYAHKIYSRFWNGASWGSEETIAETVYPWYFSATSKDNLAHIVYYTQDAGLVYKKYHKGWSGGVVLESDPDIAEELPTISVDAEGNLYVIWVWSFENRIFRRRYDKETDTWEPRAYWEEFYVGGSQESSAYGQSYNDKIGFIYLGQPADGDYGFRHVWIDTKNVIYHAPSTVEPEYAWAEVGFPYQRKLFYANGRFWAFYSYSNEWFYRTSIDGISWSDRTYLFDRAISWCFDLWFDGTYMHYLRQSVYTTDWCLEYRRGVPEADGTITWSADPQYFELGTDSMWGTIMLGGDKYVYAGYCAGTGYSEPVAVIKNRNKDGTWETASGWPKYPSSVLSRWYVRVLPLQV